MEFKLHSPYQPTGDQPDAIQQLVEGIKKGYRNQVLLGATGTGKTFTIANIVQQLQIPALVMAHNKTLAAQLYMLNSKNSSPKMQSNILFLTMIITSPRLMSPVMTSI